MSTFQSDRYQWRETYFVLFAAAKRPTFEQMSRKLARLRGHFQLTDGQADEGGMFESLTVLSPDDFAALDISYVSGEEVCEQGAALADEMKSSEGVDRAKLARL